MLVLSRHTGDSIMLGNDVEIVVLGVCGDKVRLGVTAPKNIDVHRREIWERITGEVSAGTSLPSIGVSLQLTPIDKSLATNRQTVSTNKEVNHGE